MNPTNVYPAANNYRWYGFPIRCLHYDSAEKGVGRRSATALIHPPLSFVRSDAINLADGKMWHVGAYGFGRSRVSQSLTNIYYLGMGPIDINPSNNTNRWNGFPLRILYALHLSSSFFTLTHVPLSFVRSGAIWLNYSQIRNIGDYGYGSSRTTLTTTNAYILYYNLANIYTSYGHDSRFVGVPPPSAASTLTHAPLSFVRSDVISVNDGNNPNIGTWSHSWSRVSESSTYAYNLAILPMDVDPSANSNRGYRWLGFPLRRLFCSKNPKILARQVSINRDGV